MIGDDPQSSNNMKHEQADWKKKKVPYYFCNIQKKRVFFYIFPLLLSFFFSVLKATYTDNMGNAHSTPHSVASDTPTAYPTVVRKQTNKKPQPFAHSFFESHIVVPVPHQHIRKPNRPAGHINFFEAASVTNGSTPSVRSQSSSKSSLKTSSTTKKSSLYPASSTVHSTRERKPSTATSSSSSSTSNSTVADQLNHLSLKTSKTDLAADSSDYVILNNRRYWKGHGSQTFILPCDDDESDRLMTLVIRIIK
jgi:hypothetical protein